MNHLLDQLYARGNEKHPERRLDAIEMLLDFLGGPQKSFSTIHVTGTNGKTSTSRIIESLLRAYGLRTGLYTSPHLLSYNERICINGIPIDEKYFDHIWQDIKPYVELVDAQLQAQDRNQLSFFEVTTALSFASFADAPVDVAIIEVGIGGEWDATNVIDPQVCVFTPIDYDHMHILGASLTEIAQTKSGIIKSHSDVVSAQQKPDAASILREISEEKNTIFLYEFDDFTLQKRIPTRNGQKLTIQTPAGTYSDLFLPLHGEHQAHNASVALCAVERFLGQSAYQLKPGLVTEGLSKVSSPGRCQQLSSKPDIFVDVAHNPSGAQVLAKVLTSDLSYGRCGYVLGILDDKDINGFLEPILPTAQAFFLAAPKTKRALSATLLADQLQIQLEQTGQTDIEVHTFRTIPEAYEASLTWAKNNTECAVVVTGSVRTVSEVLTYVHNDSLGT